MTERVLLVDDEPRILSAFKRQLSQYVPYAIDTANSGVKALEQIGKQGHYSVIVSDMSMPGIDGLTLLKKVQEISPDCVRVMLTGNPDQEIAIMAINEGAIFRFLTKPCSTDNLVRAIEDSVKQYKLITAEKDLLQNTLSGSIKVLTDLLSMLDPVGFSQSMTLRASVKEIASRLDIENTWSIELATMLSNIGCVVLPTVVLVKLQSGQYSAREEEKLLARVPEVGRNLLLNIPRLEEVANIVYYQRKRFDGSGPPPEGVSGKKIHLGARIIKLAKDLEDLKRTGLSPREALEKLRNRNGWYDPDVLEAATAYILGDISSEKRKVQKTLQVSAAGLETGQLLLSDIKTKDGLLLITSGVRISDTLLERLRNHAKLIGLQEPITVEVGTTKRVGTTKH